MTLDDLLRSVNTTTRRGEVWARLPGPFIGSFDGRLVGLPVTELAWDRYGGAGPRSTPAFLADFSIDAAPRFGRRDGTGKLDLATALLAVFDRPGQPGEFARRRNGLPGDVRLDNLIWQHDLDREKLREYIRRLADGLSASVARDYAGISPSKAHTLMRDWGERHGADLRLSSPTKNREIGRRWRPIIEAEVAEQKTRRGQNLRRLAAAPLDLETT